MNDESPDLQTSSTSDGASPEAPAAGELPAAKKRRSKAAAKAEAAAIEAGAQEVQPLQGEDVPENHIGARFLCNPVDLDAVAKFLVSAKWSITASEMSYLAKNFVDLSEAQKKEVSDFLNALDEHDDVHRVYAALK